MRLIIISGMSGSGKSVALNVLEDNGFYCIDNLPIPILIDLTNYLKNQKYSKVAISIDIRSGKEITASKKIFNEVRKISTNFKIIYLDSTTEVLTKRFSESRRMHPLSKFKKKSIEDYIDEEREKLFDIRELALLIDTSILKPSDLRKEINRILKFKRNDLFLIIQSFGFKYGVPIDSDFIFDVRFLPNPYYLKTLRNLDGNDKKIKDFFKKEDVCKKSIEDIINYIKKVLPQFLDSGKEHLTVSIGCTGGKHRSVYVAKEISKELKENNSLLIKNRDI